MLAMSPHRPRHRRAAKEAEDIPASHGAHPSSRTAQATCGLVEDQGVRAGGARLASLSLAEAAAATGMVKSSILRAIKSGRLSGARDDLGQWRIEASELFRVYRPVADHQSAADAPQQYAPPDAALIAELSARAVLAEQRLGDIRELLTQARQDIERWRDQADAWREQASTSQRQLTDQREREPVSLWRWFRPDV